MRAAIHELALRLGSLGGGLLLAACANPEDSPSDSAAPAVEDGPSAPGPGTAADHTPDIGELRARVDALLADERWDAALAVLDGAGTRNLDADSIRDRRVRALLGRARLRCAAGELDAAWEDVQSGHLLRPGDDEVGVVEREVRAALLDRGFTRTNPSPAIEPPPPAIEPSPAIDPELGFSTVLDFDVFAPFPTSTAAENADIEEQIRNSALGGAARNRAFARLRPYGLKAIPPLLNSCRGEDLSDPTDLADLFDIAEFIQDDLTFGMVKLPLKGDPVHCTDPQGLEWNFRAMSSMVKYVQRWYDPALGAANVARSLELYERKKKDAGG